MAFSTIDKSTLYQNTVLYTGNGSTQTITGVGFQPDMVWGKGRTSTEHHQVYDVVRTATKVIYPNETDAEATKSTGLTAFNSDGFVVGADDGLNKNTISQVAWNWKAGGSASSNSNGSITSSVSVNTTAGFSIGTFTGNATAGATVGHGLGATPGWIICRTISAAKDWCVYQHKNTSAPETEVLILNTTAATTDTNDRWNDTAPTSTVFTIGDSSQLNTSGGTCLFYAFAEISGYSKFGSYTGNGNADGTFVYTGFKPTFVMIKGTFGEGWLMYDNKRLGYNDRNDQLVANTTGAEVNTAVWRIDELSNGFKIRGTDSAVNGSGSNYIYMAFGQPIISNSGVCATAR